MTTATPTHQRENDFAEQHHVYEPHLVGLPPLWPYIREAWRRRAFAVELSRTKLRAQHFNTVFGQLWLVLNPLMLAGVYFILVDILRGGSNRPGFFAHLVAGIFAYHLVSDAVRDGTKAVVTGGRLILNSAFPRVLLPWASVVSAVKRFIPTMIIYVPIHIASGFGVEPGLLWAIPLLALLLVMASGLAMIVSALQVYFRDLKNLMPYLLRVWLFASPVLYFADQMPEKYQFLLDVNPLGQLLSAWTEAVNLGQAPSTHELVVSSAWAFGLLIVGFLFFVSREREFAVRL
ncbi:MAG TPA: ABC transporter permease [Gemmatimonadaceae bacterium]|nr:ABC transporter permease [Gemmatimonadaceae bacterium]